MYNRSSRVFVIPFSIIKPARGVRNRHKAVYLPIISTRGMVLKSTKAGCK